jgi:hypothetical protein
MENEKPTEDNPSMLAAIILKDLFNRAHVSYIPECIQPILTYDNKKKNNISLYIFVVQIFR